jgi:Lamin Tail Domain
MITRSRQKACRLLVLTALWTAGSAHAQVVFTEIMHNPGGSDALWEWVEIFNTTASPLDLDGWVFDDDDDGATGGAMGGPNITASPQNNTIVPAGGVAVLYPADELDFMPERFNNAWGEGITLIGVDGFTALSLADAVGLWPNRASYDGDAIPDAAGSPRRMFAGAVASIDYSAVPAAEVGHSIAWNGTGSATNTANWVASVVNEFQAFTSDETTIENAQINSTEDRGNPGVLPGGAATPGLRMTEIMFAPASPLVTVGYDEADFEWIELFNNSPNPINFAATPHVFDDISGGKLAAGNIRGGTIPAGATGILFNNEKISTDDMQAMWGNTLTYIGVENWPSLNNTGGDTIALWGRYADYNSEEMTGSPRTYANAVTAVTYNTVAGQGWPTILAGRSIWLSDLSDDPNEGANWTRAGASGDNTSFQAGPIFEMAIDHPGGDVGSPGFVPGSITPTLPGDYNDDGVVDAADYVVWRASDGSATGYNTWRTNFGRTSASASAAISSSGAVPEPATYLLFIVGGPALLLFWQPARNT